MSSRDSSSSHRLREWLRPAHREAPAPIHERLATLTSQHQQHAHAIEDTIVRLQTLTAQQSSTAHASQELQQQHANVQQSLQQISHQLETVTQQFSTQEELLTTLAKRIADIEQRVLPWPPQKRPSPPSKPLLPQAPRQQGTLSPQSPPPAPTATFAPSNFLSVIAALVFGLFLVWLTIEVP